MIFHRGSVSGIHSLFCKVSFKAKFARTTHIRIGCVNHWIPGIDRDRQLHIFGTIKLKFEKIHFTFSHLVQHLYPFLKHYRIRRKKSSDRPFPFSIRLQLYYVIAIFAEIRSTQRIIIKLALFLSVDFSNKLPILQTIAKRNLILTGCDINRPFSNFPAHNNFKT